MNVSRESVMLAILDPTPEKLKTEEHAKIACKKKKSDTYYARKFHQNMESIKQTLLLKNRKKYSKIFHTSDTASRSYFIESIGSKMSVCANTINDNSFITKKTGVNL